MAFELPALDYSFDALEPHKIAWQLTRDVDVAWLGQGQPQHEGGEH